MNKTKLKLERLWIEALLRNWIEAWEAEKDFVLALLNRSCERTIMNSWSWTEIQLNDSEPWGMNSSETLRDERFWMRERWWIEVERFSESMSSWQRIREKGKMNRRGYTHKRRGLHVGNCLWAAAVGIAAITVGSKRSGGGSISSATRWPSLYSIFLVVL